MSYPQRVSNAGWYPDPSGQPGQFRYWDGSGWSAETAVHPSGPPPGAGPGAHEAPTQYPGGSGGGAGASGFGGAPPTNVAPGYPQQPVTPQQPATPQQPGYGGYGGYPSGPSAPQQPGGPGWGQPPGGSSGGGSGKTVGIVIGIVVLVIALGVGTFLLVRGLSGDDDQAGDDESSQTESGTETTETETETPTESTPADPTGVACSGGTPEQGGDGVSGGAVTGGGIRVDQVAGYEPEFTIEGESYNQNGAFDFADGMTTVSRLVTDGWVAGYGVGSLARDRGYENPKQAAETAMSCLEQSANYEDVTRRDNLEEGEVDLGPTTGYSITSDILATAPGGIPGDRVVITVVDLGDDKPFGFYINYVPLGYNDLLRTQTAVGETLAVG